MNRNEVAMSDRALKDIHKVLADLLKEIKEIRRLYAADLKTRNTFATATQADEPSEMAPQETLDDDTQRELQELGLDLSEFNP